MKPGANAFAFLIVIHYGEEAGRDICQILVEMK
jgi:hypothetical protein